MRLSFCATDSGNNLRHSTLPGVAWQRIKFAGNLSIWDDSTLWESGMTKNTDDVDVPFLKHDMDDHSGTRDKPLDPADGPGTAAGEMADFNDPQLPDYDPSRATRKPN